MLKEERRGACFIKNLFQISGCAKTQEKNELSRGYRVWYQILTKFIFRHLDGDKNIAK